LLCNTYSISFDEISLLPSVIKVGQFACLCALRDFFPGDEVDAFWKFKATIFRLP